VSRPKRIKLGAHTIPVKWHTAFLDYDDACQVIENEGDGDFGAMKLADEWVIHVSEHSYDMPITLMHECLHAVMRTTGAYRLLDSREVEEAIASGFSQAIVELLRRNPGLADYLVKGE
jgi:hypothetical protein